MPDLALRLNLGGIEGLERLSAGGACREEGAALEKEVGGSHLGCQLPLYEGR